MRILWVCYEYNGPSVQTHIHKGKDVMIDSQHTVTEANDRMIQEYVKLVLVIVMRDRKRFLRETCRGALVLRDQLSQINASRES